MSGLHFHPLTVRDVRRDTDDAILVTFDVPPAQADAFRFEPGQSLTLRRTVDGQELRRSYSICAAPGEPLRVGVRHVPGGAFSGWLHRELEAGATLDVMEPQGRFGAALARRPRHLLAIAGGSGITPVLSLLKSALARDPSCRCTLLYGNRSVASTMFKEELEDLKNRHLARLAVHPVFSREAADVPLHAGRIDADKIATVLRLAGAPDEVFVCGPHAMNDEVEAALRAAGVAADRIHVERFGAPPAAGDAMRHPAEAGDARSARVVVVRDGVTREVAFAPGDGTLLQAAARAGLDLPYSCRSGVCATCRARLLEGRVRMDRNFALEPADLAAGFVLTCQAHPLTERVVVSFDER
ncbi:MAG: phenylacetic acid degradation protein [Rubrivivax sp. SCN 70-15]|nr:MAG: phenylacetic acid degradation protein [Rubrivivax sp. SCN 70-15]